MSSDEINPKSKTGVFVYLFFIYSPMATRKNVMNLFLRLVEVMKLMMVLK